MNPDGIVIQSYVTGTGQHLVGIHEPNADCFEHGCSIHNPSAHTLRKARTHWRGDRGLMERICEHGVGHPDPDHMRFVRRTLGDGTADGAGVHGCDGCCAGHP